MSFFKRLVEETTASRNTLLSAPIIQRCLVGDVSLTSYMAFLQEAYHHVRHTVPLLTATRDALPAPARRPSRQRLRPSLARPTAR